MYSPVLAKELTLKSRAERTAALEKQAEDFCENTLSDKIARASRDGLMHTEVPCQNDELRELIFKYLDRSGYLVTINGKGVIEVNWSFPEKWNKENK